MFAKFTNIHTGKRININPASVASFQPTDAVQDAQAEILLTNGVNYYVSESERTVRSQLTKASRYNEVEVSGAE